VHTSSGANLTPISGACIAILTLFICCTSYTFTCLCIAVGSWHCTFKRVCFTASTAASVIVTAGGSCAAAYNIIRNAQIVLTAHRRTFVIVCICSAICTGLTCGCTCAIIPCATGPPCESKNRARLVCRTCASALATLRESSACLLLWTIMTSVSCTVISNARAFSGRSGIKAARAITRAGIYSYTYIVCTHEVTSRVALSARGGKSSIHCR